MNVRFRAGGRRTSLHGAIIAERTDIDGRLLHDDATVDFKSLIDGGIIVQQSAINSIRSAQDLKPAITTYKGVQYACERQPTQREIDDMLFGWAVEHGVTSNSVSMPCSSSFSVNNSDGKLCSVYRGTFISLST